MTIRDRINNIKHLQNKYLICVLENPEDIKNIATVIRNVSAFGIEKLYIIGFKNLENESSNSSITKKLQDVSVGASKWVFIKYFKTTMECLQHLRKNKYTIAATSSHNELKENTCLFEQDYTYQRLAIFFGNEKNGLSDELLNQADIRIQIPMGGIVESLNLGTSSGIVLSYIAYHRLKYIYVHNKAKFRNNEDKQKLTKSWSAFSKNNNL